MSASILSATNDLLDNSPSPLQEACSIQLQLPGHTTIKHILHGKLNSMLASSFHVQAYHDEFQKVLQLLMRANILGMLLHFSLAHPGFAQFTIHKLVTGTWFTTLSSAICSLEA